MERRGESIRVDSRCSESLAYSDFGLLKNSNIEVGIFPERETWYAGTGFRVVASDGPRDTLKTDGAILDQSATWM